MGEREREREGGESRRGRYREIESLVERGGAGESGRGRARAGEQQQEELQQKRL